MHEAVDIPHPADEMRAGGRADERERHGFLETVVPEHPAGRLAGVGLGGVDAAPDAIAGGEKDFVGIVRVDDDGAHPMRRVGGCIRRAGVVPLCVIVP